MAAIKPGDFVAVQAAYHEGVRVVGPSTLVADPFYDGVVYIPPRPKNLLYYEMHGKYWDLHMNLDGSFGIDDMSAHFRLADGVGGDPIFNIYMQNLTEPADTHMVLLTWLALCECRGPMAAGK